MLVGFGFSQLVGNCIFGYPQFGGNYWVLLTFSADRPFPYPVDILAKRIIVRANNNITTLTATMYCVSSELFSGDVHSMGAVVVSGVVFLLIVEVCVVVESKKSFGPLRLQVSYQVELPGIRLIKQTDIGDPDRKGTRNLFVINILGYLVPYRSLDLIE